MRCKAKGKLTPVDVVDHVKPVRYFPELTMEPSNWQSLCYACNAEKAREDEAKYKHMQPGGGSKS